MSANCEQMNDMESNNKSNSNDAKVIDLGIIAKHLWSRRVTFVKVWVVTFALSCLWILPQPRYYQADLMLAPETGGEEMAGGVASLASSFGINLGGLSGSDAIYPMLYPNLFESPEFIVGLFDIQVKTLDGSVDVDYCTYLAKHQKKNWLTFPFKKFMRWVKTFFEDPSAIAGGKAHNPFKMNKAEHDIMLAVQDKVKCRVDKKTDVISITVEDQDPLICATLADSVKSHLQRFIIKYRTQKACLDYEHYQNLADSAYVEYLLVKDKYVDYCDHHMEEVLQSSISERDQLENELQMKINTYQALKTQVQATKAKIQEKTPAFTTLKSPTVPVKPAGPKRMIFVALMIILSTMVVATTTIYKNREVLL